MDSLIFREEKTALHRACIKGHYDIVKLLLSYGAPPDGNPLSDRTPLFETCYKGMVKFMLPNVELENFRFINFDFPFLLAINGLRRCRISFLSF